MNRFVQMIITVIVKVIIKINTLLVRGEFGELTNMGIDPRVKIKNPQYMILVNAVIRPYAWLYAVTGQASTRDLYKPKLEIREVCNVGRFCHISCANHILLERFVRLGERVLITDHNHGYEDVSKPITHQPLKVMGPIVIREGTWIGDGACIIGKVTIGRNCVIGANTVIVNRDVPDYCVVVGNPARIVRRYNEARQIWEYVDFPL